MAKIKFGMMMTDARGKLGGQVFSKNRAGSYIRTKVTPSNPQTNYQLAVRSVLGGLSSAWSSLTLEQISAWNAAVKDWQTTDIFGDLKTPSGKNLFVKINVNLNTIGRPPLDLPPAKVDLSHLPVQGVSYNTTEGEWDFGTLINNPNALWVVEATPAVPAGVSNVKNRFRLIAFANTSSTLAERMQTAYAERFGNPQLGQKVFVRIRLMGINGQTSVSQQLLVSIT